MRCPVYESRLLGYSVYGCVVLCKGVLTLLSSVKMAYIDYSPKLTQTNHVPFSHDSVQYDRRKLADDSWIRVVQPEVQVCGDCRWIRIGCEEVLYGGVFRVIMTATLYDILYDTGS